MNTQAPGSGLTLEEVREQITAGRVNAVDETTSRPLSEIIKANVFTRFNALLGSLAVLVLITGSYPDALFAVALVFNSGLGIAQEWHAKRKLDSLKVMHAPTAGVVRGGEYQEIPVGEIVAGDLVELRSGDQVPADGPVVEAQNLEVDESNLTGESDAVLKGAGDGVSSGTSVVAGHGWFTAQTVGAQAVAHKLAAEAKKFARARSEVQESTNTLLRYLTWVVIVALPLSLFSQWRAVGDQGWTAVVLRSAGGLVGLVPEGLVLLTTLAFLLAAVQLTRQNALIQELPAVEGLARVDVICVDKTGTLTHGDITYDCVEYLDGDLDPAQVDEILGAIADDPQANHTTLAIGEAFPAPGWHTGAHGAYDAQGSQGSQGAQGTVEGRVPFNSARKWSAAGFGERGAWVLGAPDVLLGHLDVENKESDFEQGALVEQNALVEQSALADLRARIEGYSSRGSRVLMLARAPHLPAADVPLPQLRAVALVVLSERVREDAGRTLDYFRSQGVAVKVISGDNPVTVAAVARRVGLDAGEPVDARQLTSPGSEDELEQLSQTVEDNTVFGRVNPDQKRDFVRALQRRGHTVAMTGDGVNDVLALKDADIGVAMGNAAQATKAVAQLVLLDGRFSNLPAVLAEGRRLIGNVERVANLFVAKNMMSAMAILSVSLFGLAFPFLPRQLTLVSTLTIGIPAAILALGPNKRRYRPGFLRRVLALALPAGATAGLVGFASYMIAQNAYSLATVQAGTLALVSLLITNFWLLSVLARPYLPWKVAVVVTMVALAALAFILPLGRRFFMLDLVVAHLWWAVLLGLAGAIVVEIAYRWAVRDDH